MSGIFSKLKSSLTKTSSKIADGIENIFFKKRLDDNSLENFEELLIKSDIGITTTQKIIESLRTQKFNKEVQLNEIKESVSAIIYDIIKQQHHQLSIKESVINIIILSGVNGSGKTTTIGKIANKYISLGKKVGIVACDTFRAAASPQLQKWADKTGAIFYSGNHKADPASVAYNAITDAIEKKIDILLIDTAGRLHNQSNLMDELSKIIRVTQKLTPNSPYHSLLVLDGTIGQNAVVQTKNFGIIANISGLIITKLDGTSKAGVVINIIDQFKLPVHFIGIGESADDLREFDAKEFANAIVGL